MHKCKARTVILALHCSGDFEKMDGCVPIQLLSSFPLGQVRAIHLTESPWVTATILCLKLSVQSNVCDGCDHCRCCSYSGTERLLHPGPGAGLSTLSSRILQKAHAIGINVRYLFQMRKLTCREGRYFAGRSQS